MRGRAAIAQSPEKPFSIEECELDEPAANELLVGIRACGICHTDLAVKHQHLPVVLPRVLGHEGAGIVERCGRGVAKFKPGDHVVLTFGSCGRCNQCEDRHPAYCNNFRQLNFFGERSDGPSLRNGSNSVGGVLVSPLSRPMR